MGMSSPGRSDEYLLLPGCSTTSVKLREGRFEIKVITGISELHTWSDRIEGARETWVKWSRKVSSPEALQELTSGEDDRWIRVGKQRDLRLISLDGDTPEEIEPNTMWLNNGCQFELTGINLVDVNESWWSFSFEAFGRPEDVIGNLERGTAFVFSNPPPIALPGESSMSYPEWLMKCTRH